jgi:histidinol-phosphate aminotransferase
MRPLVARTHWTTQVPDTSGRAVLDRNENCDRNLLSILASRFLRNLDPETLIRYPDIRGAYLSLAELTNLPPDRLFLAAGSEQAIRAFLYAHSPAKAGDDHRRRLYYPEPTYAMVSVYGQLFGYDLNPVNYHYSRSERRFSLELSSFLDGTEHDVAYLPSPDNLTGLIYDADFVAAVCSTGCSVLLDHAYIDFAEPELGDTHRALADCFSGLVITCSFSKVGGVAGMRVGYLYGHPDKLTRIYEDKPMYEISGIACAYLAFLANDRSILDDTITAVLAGKREIEARLLRRGVQAIPSFGNFSIFEDGHDVFDALRAVALLRSFNIDGVDFVRITAPDLATAQYVLGGI